MGIREAMFGPRRDDPRVVEYIEAHQAVDDQQSANGGPGGGGSRLAAARAHLPAATLRQLEREGHR